MKKKIKYVLIFPILCLILLFVSCKEKDETKNNLDSILKRANESVVEKISKSETENQISFTSTTCKYIMLYASEQENYSMNIREILFFYDIEYILLETNETKGEVFVFTYQADMDAFIVNLWNSVKAFKNLYKYIEEGLSAGEIGTLNPDLNEYL